MPKNDEGEFELILGNRQLLSVFFIVVVLLGVFFTMGYIVGRNSGPLPPAEVVAKHTETKPMVIESAPAAVESKPPAVVETKPQEPEPKKKPEPEPKREPAKADPVKRFPSPAVEQPVTGAVYLQLTATTQHEAEVYADLLKKKGFKAITSVVPEKPGLIRVLVGPIAENNVNKTKADLTAAGFPGDQAIKRTL